MTNVISSTDFFQASVDLKVIGKTINVVSAIDPEIINKILGQFGLVLTSTLIGAQIPKGTFWKFSFNKKF